MEQTNEVNVKNLNYMCMFNYEIYANILKNQFKYYVNENGGLYQDWTNIIKSDVNKTVTNVIDLSSFYNYTIENGVLKQRNTDKNIIYTFDSSAFSFVLKNDRNSNMIVGVKYITIDTPKSLSNRFSDLKDLCPYTILNTCKNNLGDDMPFYTTLLNYTNPRPLSRANSFVAPIKKFDAIGNLSCYMIFSLRKVNNDYKGPCCDVSINGRDYTLNFNKDTGLVDTAILDVSDKNDSIYVKKNI